MKTPNEHPEFDAICEQLDEFDTIPSLVHPPIETGNGDKPNHHNDTEARIDEQILAGLVSV